MKPLLLIISMLLVGLPAWAQRTTRQGLKAIPKTEKAAMAADTLWAFTDSVKELPVSLSGFEKTLRSRRESVLATNTGSGRIVGICLEVEYLDMDGNQLNKRRISLACDIPAGETRLLDFPSWDRQQVWHYYLSQPPRTRYQSTPFKVAITPIYLLYPRK